LVAAARLGARCAFAGTLGDNEASRFVIESLERAGIDLAPLRRLDAVRPIRSTILVERAGPTRTVLFDLSDTLPAGTDWPPDEILHQARILFVDQYGIEGMLRATRIARAQGRAVVADFDDDQWPGFDELFNLIDHLIVDESFAQKRTGAVHPGDAAARMWNADRQAVVVTCGSGGSWWVGRDQRTSVHQPAFAVDVVDTTGCGDVFRGGYMAGLVRGLALAECVRVASAAAAFKASRRGGYPRWEEIEAGVRGRESDKPFDPLTPDG
jgi:sulfofructose kinase